MTEKPVRVAQIELHENAFDIALRDEKFVLVQATGCDFYGVEHHEQTDLAEMFKHPEMRRAMVQCIGETLRRLQETERELADAMRALHREGQK